jgi:glutamate dehydrogenase/leucine dehydrogenase
MRWWKWVGLAGLAGVAATGVVTVAAERKRRSYTPDEIRERLHERAEEAAQRADS